MGPSLDVAPDVAVNMELTANPPDGTNSIELQAYDIDGSYIETIDRLDYSLVIHLLHIKLLKHPILME
jgi:hypothetical protein